MGQTFLPTDYAGHLACNFRGPAGTFRYLSAIDVLNGRANAALRDRLVLIGTSAAGLLDMRSTPFSSVCPGVEINATVVDNFLLADPMAYDIYTEIGLSYLIMVGGGLLLTSVLCFGSPLLGSLLGLLFSPPSNWAITSSFFWIIASSASSIPRLYCCFSFWW